jgi:hypothetical protein
LAFYSRTTGHQPACRASERAAQVFLKGQLFKCLSNGTGITDDFLKLCYPCYWHDDILFGLTVPAEAGHIKVPQCGEDLFLLEAKCLPGGGADEQWLLAVDWEGISTKHMSPFVTVDVLSVLKQVTSDDH